MAIDDNSEKQDDEGLTLRSTDGKFTFKLSDSAGKQLIKDLERGVMITEEGYRCGQCAAFPCFRTRGDGAESAPAGMCFQHVRRCRQECPFYVVKERCLENGERTFYPANGGTCKKDSSSVRYNQECHIPEMRSKVKKE